MKYNILILIAYLLVGCNLNSNVEENQSKDLIKAQILKMKIESAKIEIEHLENINILYKSEYSSKYSHSYEGAILRGLEYNSIVNSEKEDWVQFLYTSCQEHKSVCASYAYATRLIRIYELTDRIRDYNDQLNSIE